MIGAIRIHAFGGPEVLQWDQVELPPPAADFEPLDVAPVAVEFAGVAAVRGCEHDRGPVCVRAGVGQFEAKYLMSLALANAGRLGKYGA